MGKVEREECSSCKAVRRADLSEVRCEAIVWSGFYGQANASGAALLTELDSFWHIAGGMA